MRCKFGSLPINLVPRNSQWFTYFIYIFQKQFVLLSFIIYTHFQLNYTAATSPFRSDDVDCHEHIRRVASQSSRFTFLQLSFNFQGIFLFKEKPMVPLKSNVFPCIILSKSNPFSTRFCLIRSL